MKDFARYSRDPKRHLVGISAVILLAALPLGAPLQVLVALLAAVSNVIAFVALLTLISGAAGRVKQVRVEGDPATLAAIAEALPH